MNAIQVVDQALQAESAAAFDALRQHVLMAVAPTSGRVYNQTFGLWADYCHNHGLNPLDLRPANVLAFLGAQDVSKTTRQRQLSALRKLAEMRYILQPNDDTRRVLEALKLIKAPAATGGKERKRRALAPREADKVLRVWNGDSLLHKRNHALICVLALTGIRRSEAAALRWRDIDFENGVITVAHGKGDKRRDVPVAGELALDALRAWQVAQPVGREYVFCPMRKGGHLGDDQPMGGNDVYVIVKQTEQASGIPFSPHDLRRTLITEALATGTPLATVQAIAGHARGETTLHYAHTVNAREARKALRLRYG